VRNDEYDAFGPWIDEVTTGADVPRLYRDYPIPLDRAILVLKVPRDIARRDADPSMHLYDALLIVESDELTILQRTEDTYTVTKVPFENVFALADSVVLLDGRFSIHLTDRASVTLRYNGSARDTIIRLAALLQSLAGRETVLPDAQARDTEEVVASLLSSELDYGLRGDCGELLVLEPHARFVAGHPTRIVHPLGGVAALTHRFRPAHLQAGVMLETPTAMVFTHRRDAIVRGRVNDLSHASTVIFPDRVTSVTSRPHDLYSEVEVVCIGTEASAIELTVPSDMPLEVRALVRPDLIAG
jgi:hypothetical protein